MVAPSDNDLLSLFVDSSARACAAQAALSQVRGDIGPSLSLRPAEVIATLVEAGEPFWAKAFVKNYVQALCATRWPAAEDWVSPRAVLAALAEPVRRRLAGSDWDRMRFVFEPAAVEVPAFD